MISSGICVGLNPSTTKCFPGTLECSHIVEFVFDSSVVGSENTAGFDATPQGDGDGGGGGGNVGAAGGTAAAPPSPPATIVVSEAEFAAATRTALATLDGVALRDIAHIHVVPNGDSVGVAVEFDVPFAQPSLFLDRHIDGCGVCVAHSGSRFCAHDWDSQACVDPLPCRTSPCLNAGVCIPVGGGFEQQSAYEDLLSQSTFRDAAGVGDADADVIGVGNRDSASWANATTSSTSTTTTTTPGKTTTKPGGGRDYACVCGAGFAGSRCGIAEPTAAPGDSASNDGNGVRGGGSSNADGNGAGSIFALSPDTSPNIIVANNDSKITQNVGMIAGIVLFVCIAVIAAVLYFRRVFKVQATKEGLERMNGMKVFGIDADNMSALDWDGQGSEVGNMLAHAAQSPIMMLQSPDGTMIPVSPVLSPRQRFSNGGFTQSERGGSVRSRASGAGWGNFRNSPLSPQKYSASEPAPQGDQEPLYDTVNTAGGNEMDELYQRASMFSSGGGGDSAIYNGGLYSGPRRPSSARSNNNDVYAQARRRSQRTNPSQRVTKSGALPKVASGLANAHRAGSPAGSDGSGSDPIYGLASPNDARSSSLWRGGSNEGDGSGAAAAASPFAEEPIYDQAQFTAASRLLLAEAAVTGSSQHVKKQARQGTARDGTTASSASKSKLAKRAPTVTLDFGAEYNEVGGVKESECDYDISTVAHLIGRGSATPLGRGGNGSLIVPSPAAAAAAAAADPVYATASETTGGSAIDEPVYSTASETRSASELLAGTDPAFGDGNGDEHIYSTASESGVNGAKLAQNGTQRRRTGNAAEALYDTASNVGQDILNGDCNPFVESDDDDKGRHGQDEDDEEEPDYDFTTVGHLARSVTSPGGSTQPPIDVPSKLKSAVTWHSNVEDEEDEA